jgi:hypothetical protein
VDTFSFVLKLIFNARRTSPPILPTLQISNHYLLLIHPILHLLQHQVQSFKLLLHGPQYNE